MSNGLPQKDKPYKEWKLADDDPLWFLKHNPRAYGEVKDLILAKMKERTRENERSEGAWLQLEELLKILEKDML